MPSHFTLAKAVLLDSVPSPAIAYRETTPAPQSAM